MSGVQSKSHFKDKRRPKKRIKAKNTILYCKLGFVVPVPFPHIHSVTPCRQVENQVVRGYIHARHNACENRNTHDAAAKSDSLMERQKLQEQTEQSFKQDNRGAA